MRVKWWDPSAGGTFFFERVFLNYLIIIIIEGLSLLQSIPPTTADKQTQAQKRRGSRSRKLLPLPLNYLGI